MKPKTTNADNFCVHLELSVFPVFRSGNQGAPYYQALIVFVVVFFEERAIYCLLAPAIAGHFTAAKCRMGAIEITKHGEIGRDACIRAGHGSVFSP